MLERRRGDPKVIAMCPESDVLVAQYGIASKKDRDHIPRGVQNLVYLQAAAHHLTEYSDVSVLDCPPKEKLCSVPRNENGCGIVY